jgi:hypothetical protein
MADFLDQKHQEITRRLKELEPTVAEYRNLEAAAAALAALNGSTARPAASAPASAGATRRRPGRPRGSHTRTSTATSTPSATTAPVKTARKKAAGRKGRGGRPKGSGNRAAETVAAVQAQPGITMAELATKLGIKPNYLYRVMPPLQKEGKITKKGKGWHPK